MIVTPEQLQKFGDMFQKFQQYEPTFKGFIAPEESIAAMRKVIDNATPEKEGGGFISHHGNKRWL